jgi:hypothetical protein
MEGGAMKPILVALCCLAPSMIAAQPRPDARRLPCTQAAAVVQSAGAVVLTTGPYTYDRYVSSGQFCFRPEVPIPAWIATADTPQCFVGYHCRDRQVPTGR